MSYHLEGRLLEVCDCRVLCPCWIGEDPDNDTCESMQAWHFDKGDVGGIGRDWAHRHGSFPHPW